MSLSPTLSNQTSKPSERSIYNQRILVLVTLSKEMTDEAGNKFPHQGYYECDYFNIDSDIRNGMHGILWGKITEPLYLNNSEGAKWCIVQIDMEDTVFFIDKPSNVVKFKECKILYVSDDENPRRDCLKKMKELSQDPAFVSRDAAFSRIRGLSDAISDTVLKQ